MSHMMGIEPAFPGLSNSKYSGHAPFLLNKGISFGLTDGSFRENVRLH